MWPWGVYILKSSLTHKIKLHVHLVKWMTSMWILYTAIKSMILQFLNCHRHKGFETWNWSFNFYLCCVLGVCNVYGSWSLHWHNDWKVCSPCHHCFCLYQVWIGCMKRFPMSVVKPKTMAISLANHKEHSPTILWTNEKLKGNACNGWKAQENKWN